MPKSKKPTPSEIAERVRFLRSFGQSPKVDLRSVGNLKPTTKAFITRRFNQFKSKFGFWKKFRNTKNLLEFVKTRDKQFLSLARDSFGEQNVIGKRGFFVAKSPLDTKKGAKVRLIKFPNGEKAIQRTIDSRVETFISMPKDPNKWTSAFLSSKKEDLDKLIDDLPESRLEPRFGVIVENSPSQRFYNLDEFEEVMEKYISIIQKGTLAIPAIILETRR